MLPGKCKCGFRLRGPRHVDPHQAAAITDTITKRYRKVILAFYLFAVAELPFICGAGELDDALVEYKQSAYVSKSDFEALTAAVEFVFPHYKGKMKWARAVIRGWQVHHRPRHTVPMARAHCALAAVHFVAMGASALAVGMLVQRELGLRPSEMLGLEKEDISMPEHQHQSRTVRAVFALGVRVGTKAKRAQE